MADTATELQQRKEFDVWAQSLHEEVTTLRSSYADLERQLAQAKDAQWALQDELERARRRCEELEKSSPDGLTVLERAEECTALRTQLSAYAVEIDVLRKEKEESAETVRKAFAEMRDMAAERDRLRGVALRREGGADDVTVALTVRGLTLERLSTSAARLQAFKEALRRGVAQHAAASSRGMALDRVTLEGLSGSPLRARLAVAPPDDSGAGELLSRQDAQQLAVAVQRSLEATDGIRALCDGPLGVDEVSVDHRCGKPGCGHMRKAHQGVQEAHGTLQQDSESLRLKLQEEQARRTEAEQQLAAYAGQMQERLSAEENRSLEHQRQSSLAHTDKNDWAELSQELFSVVHDLQEKFVEQTRNYRQLVDSVRKEQASHQQELQEAEFLVQSQRQVVGNINGFLGGAKGSHGDALTEITYWRAEAERFQDKLAQMHSDSRTAADSFRQKQDEAARLEAQEALRQEREESSKLEKRRMWLQRWKLRTDPNLSKFMAQVTHQDGIEVRKITGLDKHTPGSTKRPETGERMMRVAIEKQKDGESLMRLMWKKKTDKRWEQGSSVNLSSVKIIAFGYHSRPSHLYDEPPERCFSVFSLHRSFDFVCLKDGDCEAFVLCLSRLCYQIQMWPVLGSITSHSKFVCARGWCKVLKKCRKENQTLIECLKEAAKKAKRQKELPEW